MKKLLVLLLVIAGAAAIAAIVMQRRSEESYEDAWDEFTAVPAPTTESGAGSTEEAA